MSFATLALLLSALVGCPGDPPSSRPSTSTDFAQPPTDAAATRSGYRYVVLAPGKGDKAGPEAMVNFYYTVRTTTGELVESRTDGRPALYALGSVIEGWRESISLMSTGEKIRVWIPERGRSGGGWKRPGTLVFDIELVEIVGD